ncbi:MFS transporter [Eubacterium sp. 1001713B170207_170306_E7]|uniref:MFS transporter n=1 Tax=Eubacterium sp. 1001713B170207_170306_E7 TaxID=2787097 RepID=UPI001899A60F|nr:MFS transporter [Eubacterium sp. 1001713B170207_170306_E7]
MTERRRELIYVCCLTGFITITFAFGRYIFSMITPNIVKELGIDYEFVGRINAFHQGAYLLFSLLGGLLCSVVSARHLISGSVVLCGVSVTLLAFVNNPWVLLGVVTLQGIFAATSWIPMVAFVAENIQEKNRGKSLGIISSGTSFGLILNGVLIPWLLENSDGHTVWLVFGVISLFLGAVGIYAITALEKNSAGRVKQRGVDREPRPAAEVAPPAGGVWRHYLLLVLLLVISGLYLIPFQSYIVPLMQEDLGLNGQVSGLCWSLFGFIGIFSGFIAGVLADRTSAKTAMLITYSVSVLSIAAVVFLGGAAGALLACAIFGLTYNGIFGLHPTYVSRILPPDQTARLFGLLNLSLGLGSMIGNYAGGAIKKATGSFTLAYQLMLVMALLAVVTCLMIKSDREKGGKQNGKNRI